MKYKKIASAVALALCVCVSGCSSADTSVQETAKKTPVEVMAAEKGEVSKEYTYSGVLAAAEEANLVSMVQGKIKKVNFDIGDEVKAGDILFTVDNDTYVNNLNSANASLKAAELGLKNAEKNYENNKILFEAGAVSQSSFDQIELAYEQAKINVESANAQIASLQDTIEESIVKSPINGVVTACNVKEGELFSASAGYAFSVMNMNRMTVKVGVSGAIINKIHKDDVVSLKISTVSNDYIEGVVKTVNPAANYSGTYDVEIEIDNETGEIKSGMFAEVVFVDEKTEDAFVVPKDSVFTENGESYVFVENNGIAEKRIVETSVDDGENIAVIDGIKDGDLIIVKGHTYVEDGAEVNVVNGEE